MAEIEGLPPGAVLRDIEPPIEGLPEGATIRNIKAAPVGRGEDALRSAGAGLAEGTAGLIGQAGDAQKALAGSGFDEWLTRKTVGAANVAGDWLERKLGIPKAMFAGKPGGYSTRSEVGEVRLPTTKEVSENTGLNKLDWTPQYLTGDLTKGATSFVPSALLGTAAARGGATLGQAALDATRFGLAPGAAQEGVGQLFKGGQYEGTPIETAARFGTSIAAGAGAGKFLSPNSSKAPIASKQTYAGQVRQLEEQGMPISPGERSDSRALRYGESEANPEIAKERLEAVTRRATSQVGNGQGGNHGVNIMDHTPGPNNTINNILTETGTRVGRVWGSHDFLPDGGLGADIHHIANDYVMSNLYGRETVDRIAGAAQELQHALHTARANGQVFTTPLGQVQPYLTGDVAHRLYSRMRAAARGTQDENLSAGLNRFADALGNNFERSVAGTPHEGALAQANRDYRNALVIEKASKASNGVAGAAGYITPAKVESAAASVFGDRAHQRGFDDFGWAPAAKSVYKTMADSGTSPREQYHEMFSKWSKPIGFALGSLAGKLSGAEGTALEHSSLMGGLFGEAAAAAPEWLMRKAAGLYSGSRIGQAHLGNQALANAPGAMHEHVYHPHDVPAGLFPRLQPAIPGGRTTSHYSVPGLLTLDQTIALHNQRAREREQNQ